MRQPEQPPQHFPRPYTGYVRLPGSAWEPVCSADAWGACWDKLLRVRRPGPTCEKIVSRTHPSNRR